MSCGTAAQEVASTKSNDDTSSNQFNPTQGINKQKLSVSAKGSGPIAIKLRAKRFSPIKNSRCSCCFLLNI